MTQLNLSVLIPVYNEEENLVPLVEELLQVLRALKRTFEVIFVDDGSLDNSAKILEALAAQHPEIRVIVLRHNAGQTAAFDAGFAYTTGEIIVTMDSDLQNDPHDIPRMLALIDQGYDFVAGWRRHRQDGWLFRTLPSRIANWMIRCVSGTKIHDLGCSLKAYRQELCRELRIYGEMHRFIGVLVEGIGAKIGELEVNHRPRKAGKSNYTLVRTFKVLLDLVTVWFLQGYRTKPSYVFGGLGAALITGSVGLCGYILWQKLALAIWVHRNPLFTIAVFFALVGVQFIGLGLLAELLTRTYFEASGQKPYFVRRLINISAVPKQSPATETSDVSSCAA